MFFEGMTKVRGNTGNMNWEDEREASSREIKDGQQTGVSWEAERAKRRMNKKNRGEAVRMER